MKQVEKDQYHNNTFGVVLSDSRMVLLTCLKSNLWKVLVENWESPVLERDSWATMNEEKKWLGPKVDIKHHSTHCILTPILDDSPSDNGIDIDEKGKAAVVQVKIGLNPFSLDFVDAHTGQLFQSDWTISIPKNSLKSSVGFTYDRRQHVFGLGEKTGLSMNKKGKKYVMWNYDSFAYTSNDDPLYQSMPFALFVSPPEKEEQKHKQQFHSIFFDNPGRQEWDLASKNDQVTIVSDSDPCRFYVSLGTSVPDLVRNYISLTGMSPLPPLYALGYQQCRYSYETEKRVKEVAVKLRELDIPCDLIYLDIDYMSNYKCFTWHETNFPEPKKLMDWLREKKFRVVTIVDPGIKIEKEYEVYKSGLVENHFCKRLDPNVNDLKNYISYCWAEASYFPDFTRQATREWWGSLYKEFVDIGVSGFWNDMNEPACFNPSANKTFHLDVLHACDGEATTHQHCHNIYGMQMARASFEGLCKIKGNERPLVVTRAGYAGIQRYAWTWTGDNTSNFDHLAMSIPMLLNMGLTGQPFTGADIGGFCNDCYEELYARWISLGAIIYPFCRTHTMKDTREQEPYSFSSKVTDIARKFIKLRYRLMPYLYTCAYFSSKTGLPMLRSLFYEYPHVPEAFEPEFVDTQVFIGSDLLVCPIVKEGAVERRIYLPLGCNWYLFEKPECEYAGGQVITMQVPLDSLPIFVRENSIIPTRKCTRENVYENLAEPIEFMFFGNDANKARPSYLYVDDGISYNYKTSEEYGLYQVINASTGELKQLQGKGYPTTLKA